MMSYVFQLIHCLSISVSLTLDGTVTLHVANPSQVTETHEHGLSTHSRLCEIQAELSSFLFDHINKVVTLQRTLPSVGCNVQAHIPLQRDENAQVDIEAQGTPTSIVLVSVSYTELLSGSC
jgi:hypothetical protein